MLGGDDGGVVRPDRLALILEAEGCEEGGLSFSRVGSVCSARRGPKTVGGVNLRLGPVQWADEAVHSRENMGLRTCRHELRRANKRRKSVARTWLQAAVRLEPMALKEGILSVRSDQKDAVLWSDRAGFDES